MLDIKTLINPEKDNTYIYHYTSTAKALENILVDNELLFNSLKNTNDPLEFQDFAHVVTTLGDVGIKDLSQVMGQSFDINRILKKVFKVCCFCIDRQFDGRVYQNSPIIYKGYCRSRMWSQYADNQKGLCLVFNREELIKEIQKRQSIVIVEKEVKYDDNLPGLINACELRYEESCGKDPMIHVLENIDYYLFMKLMDYSHEQEYRIALYSESNSENENIKVTIGNALEGIIIGPRFNKVYLPSLKSITDDKISTYELTWFNGNPSINSI